MNKKYERNKAKKEASLLDAAYDLFIKNGIHNTSIDSIVEKAGVGKGTFYLYFKDKYDLFDKILLKKTSSLIHAAVAETSLHQYENYIDRTIFFISYMIDYLSAHKLLMKIIHKNLSYSLYRRLVTYEDNDSDIKQISDEIKNAIKGSVYNEGEISELLFILIEMTGSVCYSSIIDNEPAPIEIVKPVIIKTIKKIFD